MNATEQNIIPLPAQTKPAKVSSHLQRFRIVPFINAAGSESWRVTGWKRDRTRIRENFAEEARAKCRQLELETEYLTGHRETAIQPTKLSENQIRLAEAAFIRLDADQDLPLAVEYWLKHGKQLSVAVSPRLDDAFTEYSNWLTNGCKLRELSKANLRRRVNVFVNSVPNIRVCDITTDTVSSFMEKRNVSTASKDNDRRAISCFLTWCMHRDRKWIAVNPCRAAREEQEEKGPPAILTLDQCKTILKEAESFKGGKLAPYVAVCLFGGLRPYEARRLTWQAVNLTDGEIRLEKTQTKTKKPRTVEICDALAAWLKAHKDKPFFPANWRRDFDVVKASIGYGTNTEDKPDLKPWIDDILRHTATSHYFRKTGSYGQSADQFGNSEAIIKEHYKSRVSSDETKKFYALKPAKKAGAK